MEARFDLIQPFLPEEHLAFTLWSYVHSRNTKSAAIDRVLRIGNKSLLYIICLATREKVLSIESSFLDRSAQGLGAGHIDTLFPYRG